MPYNAERTMESPEHPIQKIMNIEGVKEMENSFKIANALDFDRQQVDKLQKIRYKKSTLVCVNALISVTNNVYSSHNQEWFRIAKHFSDDEFINYTPLRTGIDRARNEAARMALVTNCDYLYFVDDDMILSPATYKSLREAMDRENADCVMAHTVVRGYPFDQMMFLDPDPERDGPKIQLQMLNDWKEKIDENGLIRVDAIGCACVLINVKALRELDSPWFLTTPSCTEDVYFCIKLMQHRGSRRLVKYFVDTKVPTNHILDPEMVNPGNAGVLKKRFEEDHPNLCVKQDLVNREDQYVEMAESLFG